MADRKIVVTGAFPDATADRLRQRGFALARLPGDADEEAVSVELDGAWGLVHGGTSFLTAKLWERHPDLAAVCVMATGYRSFIEPPAAPGATRFTYTPHANASAVAEFALAQALDLVRGVTRGAAGTARGEWIEEATGSLTGATLGVVGMGHVGQRLAAMAHAAFGTRVVYWNRSDRPELAALPHERKATLIEVFASSDVVSLHVDLVPGVTEGLIGAEHLDALGRGFLVNTARATVVDPEALRAALAAGRLGGAAIDGYYREPAPAPDDDPFGLLAFVPDRLLVTGHNAYHTHQALRTMAEMAEANLTAVADGEPVPYAVPGLEG
ncbi:NAD(P)-dependent oxidoreductase [Streptomyces sp. NPDC001941]|uniref:2-hydroxyacid dehydrogenase n=1 Tax=Streptomyces sp. NPDC001941 TaxID=3154659 RepID=UPI0033347377